MEGLSFDLRAEAVLQTLTEGVAKSSEIEGEILDQGQVRSSIARRMGLDIGALPHTDRHVEGIVEMMLDAIQNYIAPLTAGRLFAWHAALFPTGRSGMTRIRVGTWRGAESGPMQVVSGPYGREMAHFAAPSAERLPIEMAHFLTWFEGPTTMDPVLKAAVAHLWFVTIHPFEDGNRRIGRAIADLALARAEGSPQRFYSMSAQIRLEREGYYTALERTQKSGMDITAWLDWFLDCLGRGVGGADVLLERILIKARFWENLAGHGLNNRQRAVLNRLLDGFEGHLTSSKWAKLTKVSTDTALRDINELVAMGILAPGQSGGRSTNYVLVPRT